MNECTVVVEDWEFKVGWLDISNGVPQKFGLPAFRTLMCARATSVANHANVAVLSGNLPPYATHRTQDLDSC